MQTPFPFEPLLVFGFLSIMLLTGIVLRGNVPVIQRFLFPSCLIGGILGMILVNTGLVAVDASTLETFAYHFFNISFISVGLTGGSAVQNEAQGKKEYLKGSLWMALVQGISFPLQAIVGGLAVLILGLLGIELFSTFGFLVPLGFNEGPGQALSFGKVWEGIGFEHATTIGLTYASIGFFFAFFVGVPLANWGLRKGLSMCGPKRLPRDVLTGVFSKHTEKEKAGELTFHTSNVDTLAFQASLVGLVYVITYFIIKILGSFFDKDVADILWGFFFGIGLPVAILVRWIIGKIGIGYLIDPGVQRRLTGWSVDFLFVATVAAIQITVVWQFFFPVFVISFTAGIVTTLVVLFLGRRLWSANLERMLAIYGTVTGTVSCGLLLLRIVDPDFKTPVAIEIAIMNVFVMPIIYICLLLVNAPVWWNWHLGQTLMAFTGIMFISVALIKFLKLWEKPKF